jgi:hypothetical protein
MVLIMVLVLPGICTSEPQSVHRRKDLLKWNLERFRTLHPVGSFFT